LNLDQHGVTVVGHIRRGLPSLAFPTPPLTDVFDLLPAAVGTATSTPNPVRVCRIVGTCVQALVRVEVSVAQQS
jgi:hypothetical protein